jgi:hypothetical protein
MDFLLKWVMLEFAVQWTGCAAAILLKVREAAAFWKTQKHRVLFCKLHVLCMP